MPESQFSKFTVFWWTDSDGEMLCRYATRRAADIEIISPKHYRVKVYSIDGNGMELELVIMAKKGEWTIKTICDESSDSDFHPYGCAIDDGEHVWSFVDDDELVVIRGAV